MMITILTIILLTLIFTEFFIFGKKEARYWINLVEILIATFLSCYYFHENEIWGTVCNLVVSLMAICYVISYNEMRGK
jgi:hypothetical protein